MGFSKLPVPVTRATLSSPSFLSSVPMSRLPVPSKPVKPQPVKPVWDRLSAPKHSPKVPKVAAKPTGGKPIWRTPGKVSPTLPKASPTLPKAFKELDVPKRPIPDEVRGRGERTEIFHAHPVNGAPYGRCREFFFRHAEDNMNHRIPGRLPEHVDGETFQDTRRSALRSVKNVHHGVNLKSCLKKDSKKMVSHNNSYFNLTTQNKRTLFQSHC